MAPRTTGGLAGGMAHGGHIHRENYGFIDANELALAFAIIHNPDLHLGNLGPATYGGHTLGTALKACILEFTYPGGQYPRSSQAMAKFLV